MKLYSLKCTEQKSQDAWIKEQIWSKELKTHLHRIFNDQTAGRFHIKPSGSFKESLIGKIKKSEFKKHIDFFISDKRYSEDGKNKIYADGSHISGDGFPILTSSPPTMSEKESFHPNKINTMSKQTHTCQTKNKILVHAGLTGY